MKIGKIELNYKISDHVDPLHLKIFVLLIVTVLFLALFVIGGVTLYRKGEEKALREKPPLYTEDEISFILNSPGLTDFIIPETLEAQEDELYLYHKPQKSWSNERVDRYIIPPEELGIDKISTESQRVIEALLEKIP